MRSPGSARKPHIRQESCSRVLFSGSACEECLSSCPANAIELKDRFPQISESCVGCRFCIPACPNEVFSSEWPGPAGPGSEEPSDVLCCSSLLPGGIAALDGLPSSIVPCLGSIPPSFLLGWFRVEERPLRVIIGQCDACPLSAGESHFHRMRSEIQVLFDALEIGYPPVIVTPASKSERREAWMRYERFREDREQDARFSRRELFRHFRARIVKEEKTPAGSLNKPGRAPTEYMRQVIALLRKYPCTPRLIASPRIRDLAIGESCTGCGSCARLCPTGALAFLESPGGAELAWTPAHCSGCDLCRETCPGDCLSFVQGIHAGKIAYETRTTLKRFQRRVCPECGDVYLTSRQDEPCRNCFKTGRLMQDLSRWLHGEKSRRTYS